MSGDIAPGRWLGAGIEQASTDASLVLAALSQWRASCMIYLPAGDVDRRPRSKVAFVDAENSSAGSSLMSRVTQRSTVVASVHQVSSDLGGEAVILQLESGVYYGVNAVGAAIWALVREPRVVEEIQEAILAEFAVDAERCRKDVIAILRQLEAEGLIEVVDGGRDSRDDAGTLDAADR